MHDILKANALQVVGSDHTTYVDLSKPLVYTIQLHLTYFSFLLIELGHKALVQYWVQYIQLGAILGAILGHQTLVQCSEEKARAPQVMAGPWHPPGHLRHNTFAAIYLLNC